MDVNLNHQYQKNNNNNKKLSKVLSTKLSIEDYNSFVILTKLEYEAGLIKEECTSELLRFTIRHILNQVHNQPEYLILKQQEQQQIAQNNQHNKSFIVKLFCHLLLLLVLLLINAKFLLTYLAETIYLVRKCHHGNYHHYYQRKQIS